MSHFSTVIFDLDGTLLNTIDDLAASSNRVCAAHGWPTFTVEQYKRFVGNGMPKLVERFSPPAARAPEVLAATLREYLAVYDAHKEDATAPYPGIPQLLRRLQAAGLAVGVYSNKDDAPAKAVIAHYLPGLTQAVQGRVDGVPPKPDPAGVLALLRQLGGEKSRTLLVGDSDVDMLTGRRAGLETCGVLWGFRSRQELQGAGAAHLAASPEALGQLILGEGSAAPEEAAP